jgi:hypothetical protein
MLDATQMTESERGLCFAAGAGQVFDLRGRKGENDACNGAQWGPQRVIRAQVLRQLVLGEQGPAHPTAVRLRGARVAGPLNLGGQDLVCPLELYGCHVSRPIDLANAVAVSINLRGSFLQKRLSARRLTVKHSLNLSRGFCCLGRVQLTGASIGGALDCSRGTISGSDGVCLAGDLLSVDGTVFLNDGFVAVGQVQLRGARIGHGLRLTGGKLERPTDKMDLDWYALVGDGVQVGGDVSCDDGFVAEGGMSLHGASIGGRLLCRGGKFYNSHGSAIQADGLRVTQDVVCTVSRPAFETAGPSTRERAGHTWEFEADGLVSLSDARVGGDLTFTGGVFCADGGGDPSEAAIDLDGVKVDGNVFCDDGFVAMGQVRMLAARIGGQLRMTGGAVQRSAEGEADTGWVALVADGIQVGGDIVCGRTTAVDGKEASIDPFKAEGGLRLVGGHVCGQLALSCAQISNPKGIAISADQVRVDQGLFCGPGFECEGQFSLIGGVIAGELRLTGGVFRGINALSADGLRVDQSVTCGCGFKAFGQVSLIGAQIGGDLDLCGGEFRCAGGVALNADRLSVGGAAFWQPKTVEGRVTLSYARVTVWLDNEAARSAPTNLRGFRYQALHSAEGAAQVDAKVRAKWLECDPDGYSPQPYNQLAAVYRSEGQDKYARDTLVRSEKCRRGTQKNLLARAWNKFLFLTVGYGYRPVYAFGWLVLLGAFGSLVFKCLIPSETLERMPGAPHHNALLYALDAMLPIVDMGYGKLIAKGWALFVTAVLVSVGWLLVTAVVAGFASVLRRGD